MRIIRGLALGVVLAMHRDPFPRAHAGGQPEPQPEKMAHRRMQVDRPVRLVAVQVQRDRGDRDLGQGHRRQRVTPPRQVERAGEQRRQHYIPMPPMPGMPPS